MKVNSIRALGFFACLFILHSAWATGPKVIRVASPDAVTLTRDGQVIQPIVRGFELAVGDKLVTGNGAKLFISFPNGDSAVISENSIISIEMYSFSDETQELKTRLRMDEGELIADLENLKKNQYDPQFDVATQVGIAGIRGTQFIIRVRKDPLTGKLFATFGVTRGQVEVQLTGAAASVAQVALNDLPAGKELVITGDYNTTTGEISKVETVSNVDLTVATRAVVEQAVQEIKITQEANSGENSGQDDQGGGGEGGGGPDPDDIIKLPRIPDPSLSNPTGKEDSTTSSPSTGSSNTSGSSAAAQPAL